MKDIKWIFIMCLISLSAQGQENNVGISKDQSHRPNIVAKIDVKAKDAGILIPRFTTIQRDAIQVTTSEDGLLIYNTDEKCFNYYSANWKPICGKIDNNSLKTIKQPINFEKH